MRYRYNRKASIKANKSYYFKTTGQNPIKRKLHNIYKNLKIRGVK